MMIISDNDSDNDNNNCHKFKVRMIIDNMPMWSTPIGEWFHWWQKVPDAGVPTMMLSLWALYVPSLSIRWKAVSVKAAKNKMQYFSPSCPCSFWILSNSLGIYGPRFEGAALKIIKPFTPLHQSHTPKALVYCAPSLEPGESFHLSGVTTLCRVVPAAGDLSPSSPTTVGKGGRTYIATQDIA